MPFLPITLEEMHEYGWSQPDFVYVTGDAYIDHPCLKENQSCT